MAEFWIGVSGFSYAKWIGSFYPDETKPEEMLQAYSTKLNSVEINSSFYQMPNEKTTAKWAESISETFRFSFKANRRITHIRKLKNVDADTSYFIRSLTPLKGKLGCVLVQLPPSVRHDTKLLESFLANVSSRVKAVFEFRHDSWFTTEVYRLLEKYDAALCIADTEEMKPVFERTCAFAYARLRQERYSERELKDWAGKLHDFAHGLSECYVYFKHDETGEAAHLASKFLGFLQSSTSS